METAPISMLGLHDMVAGFDFPDREGTRRNGGVVEKSNSGSHVTPDRPYGRPSRIVLESGRRSHLTTTGVTDRVQS
jgi:hypothetical protein